MERSLPKKRVLLIVTAISLLALTVVCFRVFMGSTVKSSVNEDSLETKALAAGVESEEPKIGLLKPADFNKFKDTAKGQVLVINFWATWCKPCVIEFPEFLELDKKYRGQGVRIVGISADEVSDIQDKVIPFVKQHKPQFEILVQDTDDLDLMMAQVDKDWQGALPTTVVFNKQGLLSYTKYGLIDRAELVAAIEKAMK